VPSDAGQSPKNYRDDIHNPDEFRTLWLLYTSAQSAVAQIISHIFGGCTWNIFGGCTWNIFGGCTMNKILAVGCAVLLAVSLAGCVGKGPPVGKGKGKAPPPMPPVVSKG
jgi:hypothetical protein